MIDQLVHSLTAVKIGLLNAKFVLLFNVGFRLGGGKNLVIDVFVAKFRLSINLMVFVKFVSC